MFALLLAVVVLPTAGVLWFMNQAMQNEQLAVRQRLSEVYQSQLQIASERAQSAWDKRLSAIVALQQKAAPEAFAETVRTGMVDSALLYKKGRLEYPDLADSPAASLEPQTAAWLQARRLEYDSNHYAAAAAEYERIAQNSSSDSESAAALLAEARCLNKSGQPKRSIEVLTALFSSDRFRNTTDARGRLVIPNALMFALELMKTPAHPRFNNIATLLAQRLNSYQGAAMPSNQRRFLMQQLRSVWPDCVPFPTLEAEEIATRFATQDTGKFVAGRMQWLPAIKLWAYRTEDSSLVTLYRPESLAKFLNEAIVLQDPMSGIRISALPPDAAHAAYMTAAIGDIFPSWNLALNLEGSDPFESASRQRITTYIWIAVLMTVGIAGLSLLLAAYLRRQIRLTCLKNDLIATVSHELKTPLASMRLLVDTLRDGHTHDAQLVQEYLQLMSKENARLSSLIEEFLTFSRMERNKAKFDRARLKAEEIVHAALDAIGDRVQPPGCRLELRIEKDLPDIIGDRDALVSALVNLLDNALKYSGDEKKIELRSYASNGCLYFEVQDNGIGFPKSAAKKIFNRFYQVDQTLSRRAGGCGLGLSIVKFIVAAHNGSITAKSQPGRGSTFTLQLPAA